MSKPKHSLSLTALGLPCLLGSVLPVQAALYNLSSAITSGIGQNTYVATGAAARSGSGLLGAVTPNNLSSSIGDATDNLTYTVGATGTINYFVGKFASQSLVNVGDVLKLDFTVTLSGISTAAGINFRFGLFDVGAATTGATGASNPNSFNASRGYWAGYSPSNSSTIGIRQRTGTNDVLFATGIGIAPQFTSPAASFVLNPTPINGTYAGSLTLELLAGNQVKITSQFAGLAPHAVTDTADAFTAFNAFGFYINGTAGSAALIFSDLSITQTSLSLKAAEFTPVDISTLFPQAESSVTLKFRPVYYGESQTTPSYLIENYEGHVVAKGKAESDATGALSVRATLPAGYYEVKFDGSRQGQETGIWSLPKAAIPADGYLSVDAAISWLTKPEDRPALIGNLHHFIGTGGMVRERLKWDEVNPAKGKWVWEANRASDNAPRNYDTLRRLYAAAGIPVLEMFHDSPSWMGYSQKGVFPNDLISAGRSWREIARRWHDTWGALEVWNEPNVGHGGNQPADQLVPILKTVRHAMQKAGANTPLVGGVFTGPTPDYLNLSALNGLLDECDIVSFHYYFGNPLTLEGVVSQYRGWLASFGYETKPLWITEIGTARPGIPYETPGVRPSLQTQTKTALIYAMQAVEARACGVAKFFPFVYVDFNEANAARFFGMLDKNGSPLRIFSASAQAGRSLAGMTYAGDIPEKLIPSAKRIRVFVPETSARGDNNKDTPALLVIYTGQIADGATIDLPFPALSAHGIDGRSLPLTNASKSAPASDGLVYLRVSRSAISGILNPNTEAMRLYRLGKSKAPALPPVSGIVLQPQIEPTQIQAMSPRGYFLPAGCERLPVKVVVNNLGNKTRTVMLQASGAAPQRVTIDGQKRVKATMEIDVAALPDGKAGDDRQVIITATTDDSSRIGQVALTLLPSPGESSIAAHLQESSYQFKMPISDTSRWERNAIDPITFGSKPPAEWGFSVKFPPHRIDRWAYPIFTVPHEVEDSRVTGVLVRARCLQPATVRLLSWPSEGKHMATRFSIIPSDGEWHVAYIPLTSYQGFVSPAPGTVRLAKLSIGINSTTNENTLEISDLYLIGK